MIKEFENVYLEYIQDKKKEQENGKMTREELLEKLDATQKVNM